MTTVSVTITDEAMRAIRAASTNGFNQTGTRAADGSGVWNVPLHVDTLSRIHDARMAGETLSDTIIRVVSLAQHAGRTQ
jgi:hypothetical protein